MEPEMPHSSNENNTLTVDRDVHHQQSSSAPTSPTKGSLTGMLLTSAPTAAQSGCGTAGGECSSAESTASADNMPASHNVVAHIRMNSFGTDITNRKSHRSVKFPDDNQIVTGYHEAPDPYRYGECT